MNREVDPRVESSRCPFCMSDLAQGATVCPSCGAVYGVALKDGSVRLLEEIEPKLNRQKDVLKKLAIADAAAFVVGFAILNTSIESLEGLGAILFICSMVGAALLGLISLPLLAGGLPDKNSWHR